MSRMLHHSISFVLFLTVLSVLLIGARSLPASGADAGPVLTSVSELATAPGMVTVTGQAFTPSGEVYVALYDKWGTALHETRWVMASPDLYGPNGSMDPARGFLQGGTLSESFGGLCGATLMVRAFDQQTSAWSNWLDVNPVSTGAAAYGPNGSMDPALGYRPGC